MRAGISFQKVETDRNIRNIHPANVKTLIPPFIVILLFPAATAATPATISPACTSARSLNLQILLLWLDGTVVVVLLCPA